MIREARWRSACRVVPESAADRVLALVGWNRFEAVELVDSRLPWPFGVANVVTHEIEARREALAVLAEHGVFPGDYRDADRARVR